MSEHPWAEVAVTCEITGKTYREKYDSTEIPVIFEALAEKGVKRQQICDAFDVLKEQPASSPDFIVYFRGKYVVVNNVGPRAAKQIARLLGNLFKGRVFPVVEAQPRGKKSENGGKRESSTPLSSSA